MLSCPFVSLCGCVYVYETLLILYRSFTSFLCLFSYICYHELFQFSTKMSLKPPMKSKLKLKRLDVFFSKDTTRTKH